MDERAPQPEGRYETSSHRRDTPLLPPSPLAQAESEDPLDVPLPWSAVALGWAAELVAGMASTALFWQATQVAGLAQQLSLVGAATVSVSGAIVVLGAVVGDRVGSRQSRPLRWAVGMGAGSLAWWTAAALVYYATMGGWRWWMTDPDMVWAPATAACLGYVLGRGAKAPAGAAWRLPFLGLATQAALCTIGVAGHAALFPGVTSSQHWLWSQAERIVHGGLFGFVVGAVIANRLAAARRAREAAS